MIPQYKRPYHFEKQAHTANSVYVAIAGEVVNRRSVLLKNFVLNGKESASNPLLHIHAKRYATPYLKSRAKNKKTKNSQPHI